MAASSVIMRMLFTTLILLASTSHIQIATQSEPGQRMILTGKVLDADSHPVGGVEIHAFHTDAKGLYHPEGSSSAPPRLQGTLRTAPDGTYQIDTIRPMPYPNARIPAHVHFELRAPGIPEQKEILWFTGDPFLRPGDYAKYEHDGTFSPIRPLLKGVDGVLRCTRDFRLGRPGVAE
jgi:protocatechuate 3,4-dioxygenase beta subunit